MINAILEPSDEKPKPLKLGVRAPKPRGTLGPRHADTKRPGPRSPDRDREAVKSAGLLGHLAARASAVLGRNNLGVLNDALDGLDRGGGWADGGGTDGLDTRGPGPGGGGDGPVRIGEIGDPRGRPDGVINLGSLRKPVVRPCTAGCKTILKGGIDKRDVARVMERNRPRFKYCYERELQAHPNLGGKISIEFTIAPDGSVADAKIAESTMGHDEVERCVVKATRSLRFPPIKGGGLAVVTYPFVFATTE